MPPEPRSADPAGRFGSPGELVRKLFYAQPTRFLAAKLRSTAKATMIDSDNVLLLTPIDGLHECYRRALALPLPSEVGALSRPVWSHAVGTPDAGCCTLFKGAS